MKKSLDKTIILIANIFILTSLFGCGESEVEKAARRQNEADEAIKKIFHEVKPKGGNRGY